MLDEDGDMGISKEECMNFFQQRFFQNLRFENEIEEIISPLFEGNHKDKEDEDDKDGEEKDGLTSKGDKRRNKSKLDKKDFFDLFYKDRSVKELICTALQVSLDN
jgi:hypothetical protein